MKRSRSTRLLSTTIITFVCVIFLFSPPWFRALSQAPNSGYPGYCPTDPLTAEDLAKLDHGVIDSNRGVIAGGQEDRVTINLPQSARVLENDSFKYCAYLLPVNIGLQNLPENHLHILSARTKADTGAVELTIEIPDLGWWWHERNLVILGIFVGEKVETTGEVKTDREHNFIIQKRFLVSHHLSSTLFAALAFLIFYSLACFTGKKLTKNGGYGFWDLFVKPIALTSGRWGKVSLTLFLLLLFTLIVISRTVYIMCRNGFLSGLSNDVLLLLGISGAVAAGSKLIYTVKKRLSFENWSWLRRKGWLTVPEKGWDSEPGLEKAKWSDLVKVDGFFDVYSFQLLCFSVAVGLSIIFGIGGDLSTFALPFNYATLLGLSNVFYLGGRAIDPASYEELDRSVTALRDMENKLISNSSSSAELEKTDEYRRYMESAYDVAEMLKSLFDRSEVFGNDDKSIEDKLKPSFKK